MVINIVKIEQTPIQLVRQDNLLYGSGRSLSPLSHHNPRVVGLGHVVLWIILRSGRALGVLKLTAEKHERLRIHTIA